MAYLDAAKFWVAIFGVLAFGSRIINWFKDIRSKDLKEIHEGVATTQVELVKQTDVLQKGFENMCSSHSRDIQELRSDFRAFFNPYQAAMIPVRSGAKGRKAAKSSRPIKKGTKARGKNIKRR